MSVSMTVLSGLLRATVKRGFRTAEGADRQIAKRKPGHAPPMWIARGLRITARTVQGFTTYRVDAVGQAGAGAGEAEAARDAGEVASGPRVVMYLHGGAFTSEIMPPHWDLIARIARLGVHVEVPVYGLTPHYTVTQGLPFIEEVYARLESEFGAENITVAGDSAGGTLALVLAQRLVADASAGSAPEVTRAPARLLLISPCLDVSLTNPRARALDEVDAMLGIAGVRRCSEVWADGRELADPSVSPFYGSLAGLPPTDVWIGTHEVFYPDTLAFQAAAREAGSDVAVNVGFAACHDYPLTPTPEGRRAREVILASISPDRGGATTTSSRRGLRSPVRSRPSGPGTR